MVVVRTTVSVAQGFTGKFRATAALERAALALAPRVEPVNMRFREYLADYDLKQQKALTEITTGAAVRFLAAGKRVADFLEQVDYNGRRLAKLNIPPSAVLNALAFYDRLLPHPALAPLRSATVLALNNAYYRVREEEAQAFFGLFKAELEARNVDDLLARFAAILSRTFRAKAARLYLGKFGPERRFIEAGRGECYILDQSWHGKYRSYWSIPFPAKSQPEGLIQLAFDRRYEWLPREVELLDAVAERCLAAAEKARLAEEVRELAAHMFQVEEEERRRISRELHDEAGQSLLLARLQLEMLERGAPGNWEGRAKLAETRTIVERTIVEIRRILAALSPAVLEQLGLAAAVRLLTAHFRKLSPAQVTLRFALKRRLDRGIETVAYRLVQECYHNISRHAAASHVKVSLCATDGCLGLRIEDDGVGFDLDAARAQRNSFGLAGMRERVMLMGGSFEIRSGPGRGTAIAVKLPLGRPVMAPASAQKGSHGQNSSISYR